MSSATVGLYDLAKWAGLGSRLALLSATVGVAEKTYTGVGLGVCG